MTYGWAILIIAIVLGALFSLGVFSSANLAPRAQPGTCQVLRSTAVTSLAGQCNGLMPEYVAQFNGASSYISGSAQSLPIGTNAISVFGWIKTTSVSRETAFSYGSSSMGQTASINVNQLAANGDFVVDFYNDYVDSLVAVNDNKWHFIGFTLPANSISITMFVDGKAISATLSPVPNITSGTQYQVGRWVTAGSGFTIPYWFGGEIADVQVYNASLSANEIQYLYTEGIGGAPINLQNLAAWWPLNGNANDYSGFSNNGNAVNVTYTNSWTSGYIAP